MSTIEATYYDLHDSPLGPLTLVASERGLSGLYLDGARHRRLAAPEWLRASARFDSAKRQLDEYFARRRQRFELTTDPAGSPFQRAVWQALCDIAYGATVSYGELARRLGRSAAVRAVGAANGRNPLSIIVPCHRVIGADGRLTGYAGGLEAKRYLLELENPSLLSA